MCGVLGVFECEGQRGASLCVRVDVLCKHRGFTTCSHLPHLIECSHVVSSQTPAFQAYRLTRTPANGSNCTLTSNPLNSHPVPRLAATYLTPFPLVMSHRIPTPTRRPQLSTQDRIQQLQNVLADATQKTHDLGQNISTLRRLSSNTSHLNGCEVRDSFPSIVIQELLDMKANVKTLILVHLPATIHELE